VTLGDSNNDRQPEMVGKTGNTYISENKRDIIEIPAASPAFSIMTSSIKVSSSVCDNDL